MVNGKMLSVFTKKTVTGRNSRYIHGQLDLGGGVLKVADINAKSINLVEVATETLQQPIETSGNEEVSPDPIIQAEVVCDDGATTSSQVQTINADDSLGVTITQEMQNAMEIDSPNVLEAPEEFPNDTTSMEAETEQPLVEAAPLLSEQQTDETMQEPALVTANATTTPTPTPTCHNQRIENNEREEIVTTAHECEWYKYENRDDIPINGIE